MDYITESMSRVGVGVGDTPEIATTCDGMSSIQRDVLDARHNFGADMPLTKQGETARLELNNKYDNDTLDVLAAYVASKRAVEE